MSSYLKRIREVRQRLSPSIERLIDHFLGSYHHAALLTATEIGHTLISHRQRIRLSKPARINSWSKRSFTHLCACFIVRVPADLKTPPPVLIAFGSASQRMIGVDYANHYFVS